MTEIWKPETLARVMIARKRVRALCELVEAALPKVIDSDGRHGDWPITGWAMLARMNGTARSIVALIPERRATDAAVLERALFEGVVTFAWIGIDPTEHAPAWVRWDRGQRLKADNDVIASGADQLLTSDARRDFEAIVAAGPGMPGLPQRAEEVDHYWGPRITAFNEDPKSNTSMRGIYRYIYRRDSQHTHMAVASIEPLIFGSRPGPYTVAAVEGDPGKFNAFTMTPVIYVHALMLAEPMLGIHGLGQAANDVFARFPEAGPTSPGWLPA
jgi:hypothetical protein